MTNKKISNPLQTAYARRYTLTEGKETGLKVIELNNGTLRVLLNESKALDIMQVWYKGVNMSFVSKNGFTSREIAFGKRFEGGMLYTCGLDSMGGRPGFEPHGSLHCTPAKIIRVTQDEETLQVEALMEQTALFGSNLQLHRTVTLFVNEAKLLLQDSLVNAGTKPENYCILYHVNFGYPMLDEGARFVADVKERVARTEWSRQNAEVAALAGAPVPNEEETCYFLKLAKPEAALVNEKLGKKLTVSYSNDTLPHFVHWKSMASGDYVMGLEPCTTELDDRFAYKKLAVGDSVQFTVNIGVEKL